MGSIFLMNILPDMYICSFTKNSASLRPEGNSKMHISWSIENSQRMPTEIDNTGAIGKVKILVEQVWYIWRHFK